MGIVEKILHSLKAPHWGVHPDDHKRPAADAPVRTLPLPKKLYLPLQQHVGQAARPIVLVGDKVRKGQLLAEAQGRISAPVHAPTSGTIAAIGEITAPHPSGLPFVAITLAADGADSAIEVEVPADPFALSPEALTDRIAAAGIVGLGGATFPSSVKAALGKRCAVSTLIVNGGEWEPYLSCDDRVMRDHAADIVDGIRLLMHAMGAREALVGIERNKPEAIAADLLAFAGLKSEPARLIMGGPMMGNVLPHAMVAIVKGTSGILAMHEDEIVEHAPGPCIRCGSCTQACPIGLLPLEMAANVRADNLSGAEALGLSDCISCGCCAYICPSHIPLVQYFSHAKGELWAQERSKLRNDAAKRLAADRVVRLEREAKEKAEAAARRKAERAAQKAAEAAALASAQAEAETQPEATLTESA